MFRAPKISTEFANPGMVRQLERKHSEALSKANLTAMLVRQGRATEEDKAAAYDAADQIKALLVAEQKNIVSI